MSQRSNQKRKAALTKKGCASGVARPANRPISAPRPARAPTTPNSATTMRSRLFMSERMEVASTVTFTCLAAIRERDRATITSIENAANFAAVLDLASTVVGFGEIVWLKRVRDEGPTAGPAIARWLLAHIAVHPGACDAVIEEQAVKALHACGEDGIDPLLQCWPALGDYGRNLACITLGRMGAHRAADTIWNFHQQVLDHVEQTLRVGALWGLIDLKDPRAVDALLEQLKRGDDFYELFGFAALAGDERVFAALLPIMMADSGWERGSDALWAASAIAHRVGREAIARSLYNLFENADRDLQTLDARIDKLLAPVLDRSVAEVEQHFFHFYETPHTTIPDDEIVRLIEQRSAPESDQLSR